MFNLKSVCPECEYGHLDLSQEAFSLLAPVVDGNVAITWQPVECTISGNLQIRFKQGSTQYWMAIQVRLLLLLKFLINIFVYFNL